MTSQSPEPPSRGQVALRALLGAGLAFVIAWQTAVPLRPASLDIAAAAAGLFLALVASLFLYRTSVGATFRGFLDDSAVGRFLVLFTGIVILVLFSGIHAFPYPAALASGILGASIGSLAALPSR